MLGYVGLCLGIGKSYVGLYKGYAHYVGLGKTYIVAIKIGLHKDL
jgi:hypothetical protein